MMNVFKRMGSVAALGLAMSGALLQSACAQVPLPPPGPPIYRPLPPPPPPVYEVVPAPRLHWVWEPGHWRWAWRVNHYVWIRGHWRPY